MNKVPNKITTPVHELTTLLSEVVNVAAFDVPGQGTLSAEELREERRRSVALDDTGPTPPAQPRVREDLMHRLTQQLRSILGQYIVDDSIGNGFAYLVGGTMVITVTDFALALVRAAAILGPEQAARVPYEWAQGEPVPYRTCAVLSGVSVDQPFEMAGGIRFTGLPNSSEELSAHLPQVASVSAHVYTLLGAVKVTIDCKAKPALYRFTGYNPDIVQHTWAYGSFSDVPLDALCEALSLACNTYVSWATCWFECDAVYEFGRLGGKMGRMAPPDNISSYSKVEMSQRQLEEAHTIMDKWLAKQNAGGGLDLAIRRWARSKRPTSHVDQFIELRIALEALYLPDSNQELGFRLATHGAWHLGANLEERQQHYKTLRDAYNAASTAVHKGAVKDTNTNHNLLGKAQDLCRQGILKRLDEGKEPDWNALILGE